MAGENEIRFLRNPGAKTTLERVYQEMKKDERLFTGFLKIIDSKTQKAIHKIVGDCLVRDEVWSLFSVPRVCEVILACL
jgi:hypothetical protein